MNDIWENNEIENIFFKLMNNHIEIKFKIYKYNYINSNYILIIFLQSVELNFSF